MRWIVWLFEAMPLLFSWLVLRMLPVAAASRVGAWVGATFGPQTHKQRHVLNNLANVLPDAGQQAREAAAAGVWRNLGSVIAEYPHLKRIVNERIDWVVPEATAALLDRRSPALYLSGHLANWELMTGCFSAKGVPMMALYRPHVNPLLEPLIRRFRRFSGLRYVAPDNAAKEMLLATRTGESIGVLQDLRAEGGTLLPLFGKPALTSLVPFRIALRNGYPVVPVRMIRKPGARFVIEFGEPFDIPSDTDDKSAAAQVALQFNATLERWIGERCFEWLCTKRRWPKQDSGGVGSPTASSHLVNS